MAETVNEPKTHDSERGRGSLRLIVIRLNNGGYSDPSLRSERVTFLDLVEKWH
jgi:hypothetical protein